MSRTIVYLLRQTHLDWPSIISKVGSAYLSKICHYIINLFRLMHIMHIFCIYSAFVCIFMHICLHIFCIFSMLKSGIFCTYFCIYYEYLLFSANYVAFLCNNICIFSAYFCAYIMHILHFLYAYFVYILCLQQDISGMF